jgi:hypothetical protein
MSFGHSRTFLLLILLGELSLLYLSFVFIWRSGQRWPGPLPPASMLPQFRQPSLAGRMSLGGLRVIQGVMMKFVLANPGIGWLPGEYSRRVRSVKGGWAV